MAERKKRRKKQPEALADLAEERRLDAELCKAICLSVQEATKRGAYVVVRIPWGLVNRLAILEERNAKRREAD